MTCPRCKQPISEHVAGRELDICVADAMGKLRVPVREAGHVYAEVPQLCVHVFVPAYSTDPAAMMEVMQAISDMGLCIGVEMNPCRETRNRAACEILETTKTPSPNHYDHAYADTPMLAVCLAALAALAAKLG